MTVYYKMRQMLLQNATATLLQNATEGFYKMRHVYYYRMRRLLQNAMFITNCDSTMSNVLRICIHAKVSASESFCFSNNGGCFSYVVSLLLFTLFILTKRVAYLEKNFYFFEFFLFFLHFLRQKKYSVICSRKYFALYLEEDDN